jgi:glycosyltransferase involved in cell wall biosynthesis
MRSVLAQSYEPLELVVVDNNCTDGSDDCIRELARRDARVRYVLEDAQGLNPARNRGLAEAQGEWVAYLDDDELAPSSWLANLMKCCTETGASAAGGGYRPLWEGAPPRWLARSECLQAVAGAGGTERARRRIGWLPGGNACYQRGVLEDIGGFGNFAGYQNRQSLADGADVEVGRKLTKAGHELWYEPTGYILHKMPIERQTLQYVARRAFWSAYADGVHGCPMDVGRKIGRATRRGPEAVLLGLCIVPGQMYGRFARMLMARSGENENAGSQGPGVSETLAAMSL